MDWVLLETKYRSFQPPPPAPPPPPPAHISSSQSSGFDLNHNVSPSILLIIIILAIIFFISGLLHLLVRFLLRPPTRDPDEMSDFTALQGQLQQLFNLHDSGVDQSFIDTLPLFNYKAIIGVKDPFDCAVCLCEFEPDDKLRLLPKCSHAFHMNCIDTWLLSHSTCPICRANLVADFTHSTNCSPLVRVLESGNESFREAVTDGGSGLGNGNLIARANSNLGSHFDDDSVAKSGEIVVRESEREKENVGSGEKVVSVKLGKYRTVDGGVESIDGGEISAEARRCFSMGSFAYVMDENSSLKVPIRSTPMKKHFSKKPCLPLVPGHRPALSEYGCDSRREEFNGLEAFRILEIQNSGEICDNNKSITRSKRESFSVSKIWLRGKKDKTNEATVESSRRAFSFHFPMGRNPVAGDESKAENGLGCDEETQSCNSLDSEANPPSFGRGTLLWLMRRQDKVVHSSFTSNV